MFGFVYAFMFALAAQAVDVPEPQAILRTLRDGHPRLIAPAGAEEEIRKVVRQHRKAAEIFRSVWEEAKRILSQPPVQYRLVGPRLLGESRRCLYRVYVLATVYRLEKDERMARRAIEEMLVAAGFKDWNPSHFLDTAEMTHALAIGYDWLYHVMSEEERRTIRQAIIEKGLREGEKVYKSGGWWARSRYNWNQVCNGGMTIGALAIADEEPELAGWIVHQACRSLPLAMAEYAPDGAWAEGPGYWNYATSYTVYMLAALQTALGTDFGLSDLPGFSEAGTFRIHAIGPSQLAFNFADGGEGAGESAAMFWLARRFDKPQYAWHEREVIGGDSALHLWWFDPRGQGLAGEPLAKHFRHVDVVTMRTSWEPTAEFYVGLRGGDNAVNHSHLELGSFVLDFEGSRFVNDLGPDDYNLPEYFGRRRWTYYRLNTEGQNTLWINKDNQDPRAVAPVTHFATSPERMEAEVDLSAAYRQHARKVTRRVVLERLANGRWILTLTDRLEGCPKAEILWQAHTRATPKLSGDRADLSLDGKTLSVRILSPAGAQFELLTCSPPPPQNPNKGFQKLGIRLQGTEEPLTLSVRFASLQVADK
ncbi:MAG: DUF4962 domain-containing protein [Thermoguttaceae bacterium]|nr:DUF4962 domain-containing protein [Thermoguttaceae bacterium]MDW8079378.1 DUF4962 domain-containing protein [Thermoguttaceae bacterium]